MTADAAAQRGPKVRSLAWLGFLLAGAALTAAYFLLPSQDAQDVYYQLPGMLAVVAILAGIRLHRPADPAPWVMLAAGLALSTMGDWTWVLLDRVYGIEPFPSVADVFYLGGMVLTAVAILLLLRGRVPGGDRAGLLDATIVAVGVGLLSYVFLMAPVVTDPSQSSVEIAVALAYPLLDILLLGVLVRLVLAPGSEEPALRMIIGALVAYLLADFPYAVMALNHSYEVGSVIDAGWLMGAVLWGASALHPSMRNVASPAERADSRLSAWRLVLLGAASLMAPAVLVSQWLTNAEPDVPVIAAGSVVLFVLVIGRLAMVVRDLRTTLDQRQLLETELQRRALHDPLTGLANRSLFADRLEHALAHRGGRVTVLYLDLDDFKTVNDAFGHAAGDALLRTVAESIRGAVRPEDTVARLGGDEFAVLLDERVSPYDAGLVAGRLLDAVQLPGTFGGQRYSVGASIGISAGAAATPAEAAARAEELMRDADIAMYAAKGQGKRRFVVFEPSAHEAILRGLELRADLEPAIRERQFELHYQPIIDLASGEVAGVEALVRWRHPRRGLLLPAEFIPLVEATGAILPLGRWILGEAIRQAAAWRHDGPTSEHRFMSVNLSVVQLADPQFVGAVAGVLAAYDLRPPSLVLEVTESSRLDHAAASDTLRRLHELGVRLAIDDFGTGFAALHHLANVPFDLVKIDRSFVTGLATDARAESLLTGIHDLARRLNLRVVAEGVDDPAQVSVLRSVGVDLAQGYHFARPMPPAELDALLRDAAPAPASATVAHARRSPAHRSS